MSQRHLTFETYQEFTEEWTKTLGIDPQTLHSNHKGTLVETFDTGTVPPLTWEQLPPFAIRGEDDQTPLSEEWVELEMRSTIGEGGMGVVQLALQVPLQREVAIKRLRQEHQQAQHRMALLREAWITGALEHPNIIPIHALGSYKDGSPMFVMKRVEGVPWSEVMHNPNHPFRQGRAEDALAWNLDVLMNVCDAVHFAHSRGILHRDLKPENVMIGAFGEVYLLDWGIAVSLREDETRPIPRASEIASVAGTPGYMAPEMVRVDTANISEKTDIYQLGAILHQILTGHPRFIGAETVEVLFRTALSEPFEYKSDVPLQLADLCNRSTHLEPEERPVSADAFRQELVAFLRHRDSIQLSQQAEEALASFEKLLTTEPMEDELRLQIYGLFSECRFGFQQALKIWPENPNAQKGLETALITATNYEIQREDLHAAFLFYSSLQSPPAELTRALETLQKTLEEKEKLRQEKQAEFEKLQKKEKDLDLTVGGRTRSFALILFAVIFVPVFMSFSESLNWMEFTYTKSILFACGFLALTAFLTVWAHDTMTSTAINRRIMRSLWVFSVGMVCLSSGSWALKLPVRETFVFTHILFGIYVGVLASMIDPRLYFAAAVHFLTYIVTLTAPRYMFELAAIGDVASISLIVWAWKPEIWSRRRAEELALEKQESEP